MSIIHSGPTDTQGTIFVCSKAGEMGLGEIHDLSQVLKLLTVASGSWGDSLLSKLLVVHARGSEFNSQNLCKINPGMVQHPYNPSAGRGFLALTGQPAQPMWWALGQWEALSNKKLRNDIRASSLAFKHTCTMCMCTHVQVWGYMCTLTCTHKEMQLGFELWPPGYCPVCTERECLPSIPRPLI